MKASDVMEPHPSVLKPTDTIDDAAKVIMKNRFRSMPIVDEDGCYMGMFGVNCLLKQVIPKAVLMPQGLKNISFIHETLEELYDRYCEVKDEPISMCMSNEVKPVLQDTPLTETMLQLYETRASIPVVDTDHCKLLGVISYWEVGEKIMRAGSSKDA